MTPQTIVIGVFVLVLIGFLGFGNYRSAIKRGKQMYCDVNCNDEEPCDFLETEKEKS